MGQGVQSNLIHFSETKTHPPLPQLSVEDGNFRLETSRWTPDWLLLFTRWIVSDSFATPGTVARQAPLSMEFPKQEYLSGLPFPSPGDLSDWPRDITHIFCIAGRFSTPESLGKHHYIRFEKCTQFSIHHAHDIEHFPLAQILLVLLCRLWQLVVCFLSLSFPFLKF